MDDRSPQEVKEIVHLKRADIYCMERCRVMQRDGRVLYLIDKGLEMIC
ncbi:MAG: hypothetical protein Q9M13_07365 [Mariprofundales bacterium]|nr:hypothetical protein [Mariprofundales bacterium]